MNLDDIIADAKKRAEAEPCPLDEVLESRTHYGEPPDTGHTMLEAIHDVSLDKIFKEEK